MPAVDLVGACRAFVSVSERGTVELLQALWTPSATQVARRLRDHLRQL
ncbi:hypothetical protein ACF08N_27245 [Streptomyces sp. NPDC015127]